ncbi:putative Rho GTPase activation protein [Helianthus annuus]|uniref:Rho GTPase activation protein n=1 Tax=Helianthus annuus TaxID=4232 RepID=A0A251THQ7_HELAN|nr:rho GTPase-activating protein REN1 isoform X1 [Helianthus annuus]KAF5784583.1 putative Rho GTPase activation protein [Helianthus annuus]KAJ0512274.1 putative Rho GTPase activation protein [Helianthus annuus]KAJ0528368.1 putative Rho GTPase activation protein [Helianthus annuus]
MPNSKNNTSDPNTNANANANAKSKADLTKSNSASRKETNIKADAPPPSQGNGGGGTPSAATQSTEKQSPRHGNKVYKSGPLFLSSKGIGWTSWKKRWFVLTETSLVFFRSDPNSSSEKGGEANLTLGGIDLNSSGSVVMKADKKLLTVSFPDGRDGRSFTLKAETLEDLHEWKTALEEALENAPTVGTGTGQTGVSKNEKVENDDGFHEQSKERSPPKSAVLGRPVLLALEDIDGTPTFLEKALRYVEEHGIKVEGILRQAADVELVERRIQEYEQGKTEFTADEDGHVIGDCIKYVLRELPSSPVPASCCKALLQAYRTDRGSRISCMRAAICDTFPEPNRRLLQRILMTMEAVAENKDVNRMSVSAVAACMSPLLLRPLLAGEVELENEFNMGGGDGSAQLMQAAAAANHAQAIIITLLEEYDNIFGEGDMLSDLYSDSDESGSEELSGDDAYEDDDYEDGDYSSDGSRDSDHASNISDDNGDNYQHESKAQKKMPVNSSDVMNEERDEILRLETLKADLMKKVDAEVRHNSILKEELLSKKDALGDRRLALGQEVAILKEQLQRERELRKLLEAGLVMSKKVLPGSSDEKTEADLGDIAQTEAEVISLQQKLDDLEILLTQGKVKDKEQDHEASNTNKSKEADSVHKGEPSLNKSSSIAVKRSKSRGKAANTNSTLSKITNRLSFFKDKRNKVTNEPETVDNISSRKESESPEESSVDTSSHRLNG